MDYKQLLTAFKRYNERYDNHSYHMVTAGLEERHATALGCAIQDVATALCGYAMPELDRSIRLIRHESRKRRRLAAEFLRRFKGVW